MLNMIDTAAGGRLPGPGNFFQPEEHFDHLRSAILPNRRNRELRIWYAGCGTGEGAYSLGMLVDDHLGQSGDWEIIATDPDAGSLDVAKLGQYGREEVQSIPASYREAYLRPGTRGCSRNRFTVRQQLRQRIYFVHMGIHRMLPPFQPFDVILVRELPRGEAAQRSVDHLVPLLKPGGYMLLENARTPCSPDLLELEPGLLVRTFDSPASPCPPHRAREASACGRGQRAYLYGVCSDM